MSRTKTRNALIGAAAVLATSLLIFSIGQSAVASGGSGSSGSGSGGDGEVRLLANLNPPNGGRADGKADFRDRGSDERLNVEIEDVAKNARFTVKVDGVRFGTIVTNNFGTGEIERHTNDGQSVPNVQRGDLVQVFKGTSNTVVLSGRFQ
jgi:hypothetical protein